MENIVIARSALALPGTARQGRCRDEAISNNEEIAHCTATSAVRRKCRKVRSQ